MMILVAIDFSPCSRAATRLAAAIAKRTGERLVLFHAIAPSLLDPFARSVEPGWKAEAHDACATALCTEARELRERGIAVETRIDFGSAAGAIVAAAREVGADLIVIGSPGRSGAAHLFFGSCVEEVVRTAICPVLVTRDDTTAVDRGRGSSPLRLTAVADDSSARASALFRLRISPLATNRDSLNTTGTR